MLAEDYAKATYNAIENGSDVKKALTRLDDVLVRKGHRRLRRSVLFALLRYAEGRSVSDIPTVAVASENAYKKIKKEVTHVLKKLGTVGEPVVHENNDVIGGYHVFYKGTQIDNTHKSKLLKLYRNITT